MDTRDIGAKQSFVASPGHDGEDRKSRGMTERERPRGICTNRIFARPAATRAVRQATSETTNSRHIPLRVISGLVPVIHVLGAAVRSGTWMAGTSPAMTEKRRMSHYLQRRHHRACPGDPRPCFVAARRTWMAGTEERPTSACSHRLRWSRTIGVLPVIFVGVLTGSLGAAAGGALPAMGILGVSPR